MPFRPCLLLLVAVALAAAEPDPRAADHDAMRRLLTDATAALNARRFADLAPLLAPAASLTFVDQTVVGDAAALEQAFARWLGPQTDLAEVRFAPRVERGTVFTGPDTGWAAGVSDDTYTLKDGRSAVIACRWTASVVRHDGAWKLSTLHAGVNLMDNPVLAATAAQTRRAFGWIAVAAAAIALVVGVIIGRTLRRG